MANNDEADSALEGARVNIYCVRHGQAGTEHVWRYAADKIKSLGLPLSKLGQLQAGKLANYLSKIHFDHIYGSDLLRAYETAQFILEEHQYASMNIMPDIREVHSWNNIESKLDSSVIKEEQERVQSFAQMLKRYERGEQVLVVSHGNFIRSLLAALAGCDVQSMPLLEIYNASLTTVFIDTNERLHIQESNNTQFLSKTETSLT